MYDRILVPVDGSAATDRALAHALALASDSDAAVRTLSIVEPLPADLPEADRLDTTAVDGDRLASRAADAGTERLSFDHVTREGAPYREILAHAGEFDADLIVMGIRGVGSPDRRRLGSTAARVMALADRPVLAVPPPDTKATEAKITYERAVVPTDGSDAAERAAECALSFAEFVGAAVHVVHVLDTTRYDLEEAPEDVAGLLWEGGHDVVESAALEARRRDLDVTTEVLRGIPDVEILEYADRVDADLIAMGVRGETLGTAGVLGSTTGRVAGRSRWPVLTCGRKGRGGR